MKTHNCQLLMFGFFLLQEGIWPKDLLQNLQCMLVQHLYFVFTVNSSLKTPRKKKSIKKKQNIKTRNCTSSGEPRPYFSLLN